MYTLSMYHTQILSFTNSDNPDKMVLSDSLQYLLAKENIKGKWCYISYKCTNLSCSCLMEYLNIIYLCERNILLDINGLCLLCFVYLLYFLLDNWYRPDGGDFLVCGNISSAG